MCITSLCSCSSLDGSADFRHSPCVQLLLWCCVLLSHSFTGIADGAGQLAELACIRQTWPRQTCSILFLAMAYILHVSQSAKSGGVSLSAADDSVMHAMSQ